jgi:dienelactone hydrolase
MSAREDARATAPLRPVTLSPWGLPQPWRGWLLGFWHKPLDQWRYADLATALQQALAARPGPHHVHCIMNWRVTAFLYLIDRAHGVPEAAARARMAQVWNPLEDEAAPQAWRDLLKAAPRLRRN